KMQWFGGYFRERGKGFFAQFAIDPDVFFEQYARDLEIVQGPEGGEPRKTALEALAADRRGAIIGADLARKFNWKIGSTIPLIGTIYEKSDGTPWEFTVVGIFKPLRSNVDGQTMWFRFDYLDETLRAGGALGPPPGVGVYMVNVQDGFDPATVISNIDGLFENGPQVTITSPEAAFQASFVSMLGNLPIFIGTIGGAVVFAVFFSVVNTMLMAARQRIRETGIMKALGFGNSALAGLILAESLTISLVGGAVGCALAWMISHPLREIIASFFPNFAIAPLTLLWGIGISLAIGLVSGITPALMMARLRPVDALRSAG
ncbi:MAG: ABC transporter permease, partial [Planctomycetota bacterium]